MKTSGERRRPIIVGCLAFAGLLALPLACDPYVMFVLNIVGIYVIANSGLDILYGYSGQISLGQAGFYAIGAYGSAILSRDLGVPVLLSMPAGALLATVLGALVAIPAVRLVHHFLAMVTIGFGEIIRLALHNGGRVTGGPDGLASIPNLRLGPFVIDDYYEYYYLVLLAVIVALCAKNNLVHSSAGRTLMAIREDPVASGCVGVDVARHKVIAFSISAFYAGFAGALYAHLVTFVSPETFSLEQSVAFLTMVLLGGAGSLWGPVLGSGIIHALWEGLQDFREAQMAIYGAAIILVLFFMPTGIYGKLGELTARWRRT